MQPDPTNRSVELKAGEKTYRLKYVTRAILALEAEIGQNFISELNPGMTLDKLVKYVRWGLWHEDNDIDEERVEKLVDDSGLCTFDLVDLCTQGVCLAVFNRPTFPSQEELKKKWPALFETIAMGATLAMQNTLGSEVSDSLSSADSTTTRSTG